ncbi:Hypothetical protein FKW44_008658, partial [Caligus rogercresseyi]
MSWVKIPHCLIEHVKALHVRRLLFYLEAVTKPEGRMTYQCGHEWCTAVQTS